MEQSETKRCGDRSRMGQVRQVYKAVGRIGWLRDARSMSDTSDTRLCREAANPPPSAPLPPSLPFLCPSPASDDLTSHSPSVTRLRRTISNAPISLLRRFLRVSYPPYLSLPTALKCRCTRPTAITPGMSPSSGLRSCQERQFIQHMTLQNLLSIRVAFSLCYYHANTGTHLRLVQAITFLSVDGVSLYARCIPRLVDARGAGQSSLIVSLINSCVSDSRHL